MKTIKLNQGRVALVDDWAFSPLSRFEWKAKQSANTWYAYRAETDCDGKVQVVFMHREVLRLAGRPLPPGMVCDHRDCDGLNNQRDNLRAATVSQNAMNREGSRNGTSRYKGVSRASDCSRWVAAICVNGKSIRLGSFHAARQAAKAYDAADQKYFGEFAWLNFPPTEEVRTAVVA